MDDNHTSEKWREMAIVLGREVYERVNLPEYVGTEHETGYILMFFNALDHQGKATLVAEGADRAGLKKILKYMLRNLDRAQIIKQGGAAH